MQAMDSRKGAFVVGLLCGGILVATVWGGSVWRSLRPELSPDDAALYDQCLTGQQGNTVACDAFMRAKAQDEAMKKKLNEGGAKMLAAGASKREVVEWAIGMGGVGHQISDAASITMQDLQSGKY
jgi:hypothetical protein